MAIEIYKGDYSPFAEVKGGNLEIPAEQVYDNVHALIGLVLCDNFVYVTHDGERMVAAMPVHIGEHFSDIEDKYWRMVHERGVSVEDLAVTHRWTPEGGPVPRVTLDGVRPMPDHTPNAMSPRWKLMVEPYQRGEAIVEYIAAGSQRAAALMPAKMGEDYEAMEGAIMMMDGFGSNVW